ncbi:MAG: hypothetical protein Q9221_008922 [Calogaya cf. arnoldii]
MPNRYSHAFVLSRYETKGFITPRPLSPPAASFAPSELALYRPNDGDSSDAPSLDAVPPLSDASTTSTASSLGDPPEQPSHSASSSIVTEIYAPQAPSINPIPATYAPAEEKPRETQPPASTSKRPPRPSSPQPPKSRFSSFHDLSPFISKHSSSPKPDKKSSRRHSHLPSSKSSKPAQPSASSTSRSRSHITHQSWQPPTTPDQQPYHPALYYKRLEPTFDTDSLASLSLEELEQEGRQSPNMDVLPWEYPETHSASPSVCQPSGSHPPPESNTNSTPPPNQSQHPAPTHTGISLPTPSMHSNSANQPIKYFPHLVISAPQRRSMTSTQSYIPSYHSPPPSVPLPDPPIASPLSILQHTLSHHLSTESFDSAAPPPIRLSQVGAGHEMDKGKERKGMRMRNQGI